MTSAKTGEPSAQDWEVFRLLWESHAITSRIDGRPGRLAEGADCACGWNHAPVHGSVRPVWTATDTHLAAMLPEVAVTAHCWCSRLAVYVEGTGAWYHADKRFMGHEALTGGQPPAAGLAAHPSLPAITHQRGHDMTTTSTASGQLTRAEKAYAHLASFQRGQAVEVASRYGDFVAVGTVTTAQQHDHADINRTYLVVTSGNTSFRVTVGSLLSGRHAITAQVKR